jgi:DNA-binding NarL/FixJ family response regulator
MPAAPAVCPPEQKAPAAGPPEHLREPLSQVEARVLRILQTSLSAPEIACELYVPVNTVRTHMRRLLTLPPSAQTNTKVNGYA